MKKFLIFCLFSFSFLTLAANFYYLLVEIKPVQKAVKKSINLKIEGNIYKYTSKRIKVEVEPMLLKDLKKYYSEKSLENPFDETPEGFNYIFFRVRIENLSKETNLEFSPSSAVLNDMLSKDDTTVYQMFYEKPNGDKKLEIVGKTMFFKPLTLPPGQWIERLLFFEYDQLVPIRKMTLILANITAGREMFELEFPFETKFAKEKSDAEDNER
ncbi:MAG: hypothetical protein N2445_09065 [Acidobacteria bacterium]|nr:hypothetical protein [Acidobacteriota bacterium]